MIPLRRTLKLQAALWAGFGVVCLAWPSLLDDVLFGVQTQVDAAIWRVLGVLALVLAMLMVLVAQHLAEAWWWSWSFVLLEAGVATVCVLRALTGPAGSPTLGWWVAAIVSISFGLFDLLALARAEQAKPFV